MRQTLKNRFLLPTLATIVLGMGILGFFSFHRAKVVFIQMIEEELGHVAETAVSGMATWIQDRRMDLESWSQQRLYSTALQDGFLGTTARTYADKQLNKIKEDYGYYENIILADRRGRVVAMADPRGTQGVNISGARFFKEAMGGRSHISQNTVISPVTGRLVFMVSAPVGEGAQVRGVLFGVLDAGDFVQRFASPIHVGKHGFSYVFRRNGQIISPGESRSIMGPNLLSHPFGQEMMTRQSGVIACTLNGRPMTMAFRRFREMGWGVAVSALNREILAPVRELRFLFWGVAGGIIMVVAGAILFLARSVSRPMSELVSGVEKMGKGDLNHRISEHTVGGIEEIREVALAVNEMGRNLEQSQSRIQTQNELLSQSRDALEETVEERTRELRVAESEYRSLFENSVEGLFRIRPDGRYLKVNPALAGILGFETLDDFPRFWRDVFLDPEEFKTLQARARKRGEVLGFETQILRRDGSSCWCSISVKAMRDGEDRLVFYEGSVRDLTDHLEKEKAFRDRESALAATRLKSEFLANMSHEIRTPLNTVIGFCELLSNLSPSPEQQGYINAINSAGKSLLTLINDILDLSKMEAGKFEIHKSMVSLSGLMGEIESMFSPVAQERGLGFKIEFKDEFHHRLWLDEVRLRQVLVNLVGNAFKFTDQGRVDLILSLETDTHTRCRVCIRVKDTGRGIPEAQFRKIFQPFEQGELSLRKRHGGIGLGLPICRRLVRAMNGTIEVESEDGRGSCFTVLLRDVEKGEKDGSLSAQGDSAHGERVEDWVRLGDRTGMPPRLAIDPTTLYPELGRILQQEMLPRVAALKDAVVVNEVGEVARELEALSETHDCPPLKVFARDLTQAVAGFDIHKIQLKLDEFIALEAGLETTYQI
ncbi:MAG: ATP-binding protein [Desulfobacterales bacterium]|nr:ATP-binding protein [Desulfobacterales bacterium]